MVDDSTRHVLFITKFSVSPGTALGVQTDLLMRAFPGSINLYWATPQHLPNTSTRIRLENALVARAGRLQGDRPGAALVRAAGLSWWRSNSLRRSRRGLVDALRTRISQVYVTPIDREDAARMRQLVTALGRPFVVHFWDSMSGPLLGDEDLIWLVRHADRVFVLSEPLADDVRTIGVAAETLLFTRSPTQEHASAPDLAKRPLRIALLGLLDPYADGVVALHEAISILAERGIAVEPVYIGKERGVAVVNERLDRPLTHTGFLSAAERDRVLASCHLGFLPGPTDDPGLDMRSRYSIPSRSLDFLSVGLPTIGIIHPRSATAIFYARLGLGDLITRADAASLALVIEELAERTRWQEAQARVDDAWQRLQSQDPAKQLQRAMGEIARSPA